jgi:tyrosine-protein kinase Etk/Wzc
MSDPAQSNAPSAAAASSPPQDDDEINLLDLLIVLAKYKKLILGLPLVVAVLAAGISLLIPNTYTATTRILPPQGQSSASAMLAQQLGGLAGLAGGAAGLRNPNDLYIGMLKSRTVADSLIQRFDLQKRYDHERQSDTRKELEEGTAISSGKLDGIITIAVDDRDPRRAAEIANAYVEELFKLTQVLAVTEASQRRLFFERQLSQAKDNLVAAEVSAREALQTGGLVQVEGQGRAILETTARLRAQITVKDVQIGAMRAFAADSNPELQAAQQELEAIKRELAKIEGDSGTRRSEVSESKGNGSNSLGLLRNVKYYEAIFELLAKQYELAKIDEARDSSVVQILDKAIEPDRKSKPRRSAIVILSAIVVFFAAIVIAFILSAFENIKENPKQAERLALLKEFLFRDRTP